VRIPDSLTTIVVSSIIAASRVVWFRSTRIVRKSLLFTPSSQYDRSGNPAYGSTRSRFSMSCVSTSVVSCNSRARIIRSSNSAVVRHSAISRIASAPAARDSHTCHGSTMKSFRSTGSGTASRIRWMYSSRPPKYRPSVRHEIADAPAPWYFRAMTAGSNPSASYSARIHPADGLRRLISAMIEVSRGDWRRATALKKFRGRPNSEIISLNRSTVVPTFPSSTSRRLCATIWLSVTSGMGASSGIRPRIFVGLLSAWIIAFAASTPARAQTPHSPPSDQHTPADHPIIHSANPAAPADPSPWIGFPASAAILSLGALSGWILWRWRLLAPDHDSPSPFSELPETRRPLRRHLEAATLLASGLCVWLSLSLGAASARALFALTDHSALSSQGIALTSAGAYLAAAFAAALCLTALPGTAQSIGIQPPYHPRALLLGAGLFLLVFPAIMAVGHLATLVASLLAWLTHAPSPDLIAHDTLRTLTLARHDASWWLAVAAVVLGAPLAEEFVYRGCLQNALERIIAARAAKPHQSSTHNPSTPHTLAGAAGWLAIVLTSLIFAAAHLGVAAPQAVVTLFALSLAFGAAYRRSRRLATPILMHALFNALNIALASA